MNRDERIDVLVRTSSHTRETLDAMSEDVLHATYDHTLMVLAREHEDAQVRADRAALARVHEAVAFPAPIETSRLDQALENQTKRRAEEARGGPPAGALTRKPS